MRHRIGTNQYCVKPKYHFWSSIWFIAFLAMLSVFFLRPTIVSPCPDTGCYVQTVYVVETKSELEKITAYIIKVFGQSGRNVATKALACFISESGLDPNSVSPTNDRGIAQISAIYHPSLKKPFDFRANIDYAYRLYKERGNFSAWYGKGCR